MALRRALLNLRTARPARGWAGMATAADPGFISTASKMIDVTVVHEGQRYVVKGMVGRTLAETLANSGIPELEANTPIVSPECGPDAHVSVPPGVIASIPEMTLDEKLVLTDVAETVTPRSRLASSVRLTKDLDGLVVAFAPMQPFKTI